MIAWTGRSWSSARSVIPRASDDRLQAIAVARLAKADPAAVALYKDDKWHAFETMKGIDVNLASALDPELPAAEARERDRRSCSRMSEFLPELSGIATSGQQVQGTPGKSGASSMMVRDVMTSLTHYEEGPCGRQYRGAPPTSSAQKEREIAFHRSTARARGRQGQYNGGSREGPDLRCPAWTYCRTSRWTSRSGDAMAFDLDVDVA